MPHGRSSLSSPEVLYVSRLAGLGLLDAEGATIGRIDDVVFGPPAEDEPPQVIAFVASVQRRRIFARFAWAETISLPVRAARCARSAGAASR